MPTTERVGVVRITVDIDPRVANWLKQRAADEGVALVVVLRRALDREMVANPLTTNDEVTQDLFGYMQERWPRRRSLEEGEDDGSQ